MYRAKKPKQESVLRKLSRAAARPINAQSARVVGPGRRREAEPSEPAVDERAVRRAANALERAKWERENGRRGR